MIIQSSVFDKVVRKASLQQIETYTEQRTCSHDQLVQRISHHSIPSAQLIYKFLLKTQY